MILGRVIEELSCYQCGSVPPIPEEEPFVAYLQERATAFGPLI